MTESKTGLSVLLKRIAHVERAADGTSSFRPTGPGCSAEWEAR